jgi:hypothetical protein
MTVWVKWTLAGLVLACVALTVVILVGTWRQRRITVEMVDGLLRQPHSYTAATRVTFENFNQLRTPVARYFRLVLRDGQSLIRSARFAQIGQLRISMSSDRWSSFTARQTVAPFSVGFLWDAKVHVAPLLHVRVRDAYVAAQGRGAVSLLSAIELKAEAGGAELNAGELYRFLAEAVWYPTALLPREGLAWRAIDKNKALVTLTHAGTTVSVEFRFNDLGEVTSIYAPGRPLQLPEGGYEVTPWEGRVRGYEEHAGMRIPTEAEVGWYVAGTWSPVWRGTITSVDYEFVQ